MVVISFFCDPPHLPLSNGTKYVQHVAGDLEPGYHGKEYSGTVPEVTYSIEVGATLKRLGREEVG